MSSELRKCLGRCGQYKEHCEFFFRGDWKRDGTKSLRNSCKTCEREAQARATELRQAYGPPPEQCEICERRRPVVCDHDHRTGAFRGWICARCNSGIGLLGDDVAGLRRAVAYLERSSAANSASRSEESERSRSPRRHGDSGGETSTGSRIRSLASASTTGRSGKRCSKRFHTSDKGK